MRPSFSRAADLWDAPGRESEKPYFGRLTTDLPVYSLIAIYGGAAVGLAAPRCRQTHIYGGLDDWGLRGS